MNPQSRHLRRTVVLSAAAFIALTGSAMAQVSAEQQSAMRESCRSDFMSLCSGVSPGGKEALACLQKNVASLSPACGKVVSSTMPTPAAAPAPATSSPRATTVPAARPTTAQQSVLRASCQSDFMAHCSGVSPGGQAAFACLQKSATALSPSCRKAVAAIGGPAPKPAAKPAAQARAAAPPRPAPAAPTPPAAAMPVPTPEQVSAVKFTCRRDVRIFCRGVPPNGPDIMACLQRISPRLSPDCRTSLAALAHAAPAAPPPPPLPAAAIAIPTAQQVKAVIFTCRRDFGVFCRGVEPGGGRALACLKANAPRLSPDCRTSLAAIAAGR